MDQTKHSQIGRISNMNVEIRGATQEERSAVCHLIDLAFDAESHGPSLENPCNDIGSSRMDPYHRPENTRILLVDGQLVSVVHVIEREAYVYGDRFPFGFIAVVATHPDHRRRGYMRRVMTDAQAYMQRRGFCYGLLMGGWRDYGGSLGWRLCSEKFPTLGWKYVVPARGQRDSGLCTRVATEDDIPFLARVYEARYGKRFGPVIRSHEYWRRWSLKRPWEGIYITVCDGTVPVGYFRIPDEIGWDPDCEEMQERVFLSATSWTAKEGGTNVTFYVDEIALAAFHRAFGDVPRTFTNPLGQPVEDSDPTPYRPANWPEGWGLLVKFLNPGPGILADVDSTDALTDAFVRHSWTYFDGDTH
jgi:GNAT superfamily N-acetyltransferase